MRKEQKRRPRPVRSLIRRRIGPTDVGRKRIIILGAGEVDMPWKLTTEDVGKTIYYVVR